MTRLGAIGFLILSTCLAVVGCSKKMDTMRQAWLDEASACPAPAACSGKMSAGPRQVSICEPLDKKSLVHGDVVVTMELGGTISTVGRVVEKTTVSAGYRVEFPDGFTLDRSNDEIVGRVCR